jgi:hypothetical protein
MSTLSATIQTTPRDQFDHLHGGERTLKAYRSSLERELEKVQVSPGVRDQVAELSTSLDAQATKLIGFTPHLQSAAQCARAATLLQTVVDGLTKDGKSVVDLAQPLTEALQAIGRMRELPSLTDQSKTSLVNHLSTVFSVVTQGDSNLAGEEFPKIIATLDRACGEIVSPAFAIVSGVVGVVKPLMENAVVAAAHEGLRAVSERAEELKRSPSEATLNALVTAVQAASREVATAVDHHAGVEVPTAKADTATIERYIASVTGNRPTFHGWLERFRALQHYVSIRSAPESELTSHHAPEMLERAVTHLGQQVEQLATPELLQFAGLIQSKDLPPSIAERFIIEDLVTVRLGLSQDEMALVNHVLNIAQEKGEKVSLNRRQLSLESDLLNLNYLSDLGAVRGDNKALLGRILQEHFHPDTAETRELFEGVIAAGGAIVPKEPVIPHCYERIKEKIDLVKRSLRAIDASIAASGQHIIEAARLSGISPQSAERIQYLKDAVTLLFSAGYLTGPWSGKVHERALGELEKLKVVRSTPVVVTPPTVEEEVVPTPEATGEASSEVNEVVVASAEESTPADEPVVDAAVSESVESDQAAVEAETWKEMFLDDAKALGVDLSNHIGEEFDFDAAYELTGKLVRRLGESLDSPVTFGSSERGEGVVCRIIERNFAALLAASSEDRDAWLDQACYSLSSLRFAESFTHDKGVVQSLSDGSQEMAGQELLEVISIGSGEQIAATVSRLENYNESLGKATVHLWGELGGIPDDIAAQMQFVRAALGEDMFSGLLPSRIEEIFAQTVAKSGVDSAEAAATNPIVRDRLDARLDDLAKRYAQSGIGELREKDAAFYRNLAHAIAYGWGKVVQQANRGVRLIAFKDNLQRGARGIASGQVDELLQFGKAIGLFRVVRHDGAQSVVLDRSACSEELERFIYEIHEIRRSGGATGTAGNTSASRSDPKPVRKKG